MTFSSRMPHSHSHSHSHLDGSLSASLVIREEQPVEVDSNDARTSTRTKDWGSAANLCSATLGAGAVSLPYAFERCGLLGGISLLVLAGWITGFSIQLLAEAVSRCGTGNDQISSYEAMAHRLCGPKVGYLVEFSVIIFCFGVCVAYIVAVGDMLEDGVIKVFHSSLPNFISKESGMFIFWLAFMFPLSCLKKIDSLKFSSCLGVASILFLVFVTVFESIKSITELDTVKELNNTVKLWPSSLLDILQACPIIMFSFSCQVNVPQIYSEMKERSVESLMNAVRRAVSACFTLYFLMGSFGYLQFGSFTNENILKNYCVQDTHDGLVISAFLSISLAIVVAFPLNVFPCRAAICTISSRFTNTPVSDSSISDKKVPLLSQQEEESTQDDIVRVVSHNSTTEVQENHRFYAISFLVSFASFLIARIVPDISVVFGLIGGTAAAILGFVMPALFALKLNLVENNLMKKISIFLLLFGGIMIGITATAVTIYQTIHTIERVNTCDDR